MRVEDFVIGKIYSIAYGPNKRIIGRYHFIQFQDSDSCGIHFFDYLHYYDNFEVFRLNCVYQINYNYTLEEIRPATTDEKLLLIKFEIENDCI